MSKKRKEKDTLSLSSLQLYELPSAPDGGYGWVIVLAAFFNNMIADGLMFSFGIIYIEMVTYYDVSHTVTSLLFSLFNGIPLLMAPIVSMLTEKVSCRFLAIIGAFVTHLGFFLSYFPSTFPPLLLTLGLMAPMGLSCLYLTGVVMVSRYFDRKRAFATGIAVSGSGVGAIVFSCLINFIQKHFDFRNCIFILAATILAACFFGLLYRPIRISEIDGIKAHKFQNAFTKFLYRTHSMANQTETLTDISDFNSIEILPDSQKIFSSQLNSDLDKILPLLSNVSNVVDRRVTFMAHLNSSKASLSSLVDIPVVVSTSLSSKSGSTVSELTWHTGSSSTLAKQGVYLSGIKPYMAQDFRAILGRRTIGKFVHVTMETTKINSENDCPIKSHVVAKSRFHAKYFLSLLRIRKNVILNPLTIFWIFLTAIVDVTLLKRYTFLVILLSNFLLYSSFPLGYNNLPSYANENGMLDNYKLPIIIGVGNVVGQIMLGYIADFEVVQSVMLYTTVLFLTGFSCLLLPLVGPSRANLIIFSMIFGLTVSANFSLCSVILIDIYGLEMLTNTYGLVLFVQGMGSLVGPIIVGLIRDRTNSYRFCFVYCGVSIIISTLIMIPVVVVTNTRFRLWKSKDSSIP